jgi:4-alpha-glucanotransferase
MNYPGNPSGNWFWRMPDDAMSNSLQVRIKELNFLYDRENLAQNGGEENKNSDQDHI